MAYNPDLDETARRVGVTSKQLIIGVVAAVLIVVALVIFL